MSLTWGTYSTPDTTSDVTGGVFILTAEYDFSGAYEDNTFIQVTINVGGGGHELSQQAQLDMLAPLHDALIDAGWTGAQISQEATVYRAAV